MMAYATLRFNFFFHTETGFSLTKAWFFHSDSDEELNHLATKEKGKQKRFNSA